ncbi:MAG: 5-carboxymethyl-2-hydroxymuconate Delta-isomerase [bacterium]|nr:5-carboxymethyl-2-hydroxymuconate Delta-isomerase [bacterium]
MPHCILEHSINIIEKIDAKIFFEKLHKIIIDSGPFNLSQIKSRVIAQNHYYVGDGSPNSGFIFLQISILSGRELLIKQTLGERALKYMEAVFSESKNNLNCSITVEIREMDKETHWRFGRNI